MTKHKVFETARLILKPTSREDAAFFFELLNSPTWIKYIGDRNIKTIEDARALIVAKIILHREQFGYSNYTVIRKLDNLKIGSCGLYNREGVDGVDISFAFLPEYEKRGYAFEAASRIKEAAFIDFGLKVLSAYTTTENIPSQRLLEKLGMKLYGTTKLPNQDQEFLVYITKKNKLARK